MEELKVISVNVQKSLANIDGTLEWAINNRIPVVCVQEPPVIQGRLRRHPGFHVIGLDDRDTRTATYIAKTHKFVVTTSPRTHTTTTSVQGADITNVYWHPQDRQAAPARTYLPEVPTLHSLIVGDFNAHHHTWDPRFRNSPRGTEIDDLMATLGLHLLNTPGVPTHRHAQGESTIDLAFGVDRSYMRVGAWVSDHRKLIITIPAVRTTPPPRKYLLPPDQLGDAVAALHRRLPRQPHAPTTADELDELAWSLTDTFEGTIREFSIPVGGRPKSMPWWNPTLAEARETDPAVYRKVCRDTRQTYYKDKIDNAKSPKDLGSILRWRKDPLDDRPTLINTPERRLTHPEEIATYLAHAAFRPPGEDPLPPYVHHGNTLPPDIAAWALEPPSDDELKEAFLRCGSNTPGPDGITLNTLKAAWNAVLPYLRAVTTASLLLGKFPTPFKRAEVVTLSKPGRDPHSYKGWRPIALLSTIGKGIERLMARRMTVIALNADLIPRDSAGALPTRSATDLVTALTHDAEGANRLGWHGIILTFDIDSAFPSTRVDKLSEVLTGQGWPPTLNNLIQDFCTDRSFGFRWANSRFHTNSGLPQGSPWSPILFLLFTASLPKRMQGPAFSYADDIAHLTVGKDATQTFYTASRRATDLHEQAAALGLKIDHRKTEALYLPPRGKNAKKVWRDPARIIIDTPAGPVRPQKEMRWLGVHLDAKLSLATQIRNRVPKATAITGLAARINQVSRGLPPTSSRHVFVTCLLPTLTYGAAALFPGFYKPGTRGTPVSTNVTSATHELETAASKALRRTMPIWRTVPKQIPFWLAGVAPTEVLGREVARTAARLHTLPGNHPLTQRLRRNPPRGWSRLHSLADTQDPPAEPPDEFYIPRLPALRQWFSPGAAAPAKGKLWTLPPEADPELYWATNRPGCLADLPWYKHNPYLALPRPYLARWIGERTGHWDFHSYHERFHHPQEAFRYCICGAPREKGHFFTCPIVTYRNPNAATDTPQAFGTSYATFIARTKALKDQGYTHIQVMGGGRGYRGVRIARVESPDPDDEPIPFEEARALPGSGGLD